MIQIPNPISANRRWSEGDRFSASHLNDAPDAIDALINALASQQPDGTTPIQREMWPGIISSSGPNKEADFTDERYWVQRAFIQGSMPNDKMTITQEVAQSQSSDTTPSGVGFDQNASNIFVVTNLPDLKNHSHTLQNGAFVWVWAWWDSGLTASGIEGEQPANQKHYFCSVSRPVTLFKITGTATKPGMYTANFLNTPTSPPDHTSSSALADTDFGVADTTSTVYLINVREEGAASGHTLSSSTIPNKVFGFYRGQDPNDGKPIYAFDLCQ